MSVDFCPECGHQVYDPGVKHCGLCGARLPEGAAPAAPDEKLTGDLSPRQTVVITGSIPNPGMTSEPYPPVPHPQPLTGAPYGQPATPEKKPFPWKIFLPVVSACFLLAAITGAALAFSGVFSGDESSTPIEAAAPQEPSGASSAWSGSGSGSGSAGGSGSGSGSDAQSRSYVASMNSHIAENQRLEQQIVSTADEINRVGPHGIDYYLLESISDLEDDLGKLRGDVNILYPPGGFPRANSDFLQLIDYNITRANSLYRGASAWRSGYSDYRSEFLVGQRAKEAYYQLYPQFEQEYANARSG